LKSYTLVDAFTSTGASGITLFCATAANCTSSNNLNFALANDIDASNFTTTGAAAGAKYTNMRILGTGNAAYNGTFAGLGHSVTGLSLTGTTNVGLFYSTTGNAQVRDVRLSGVTLSGGTNTGALVASAASGFGMINVVMDAVTASNTISSNNSYLGAL
jgi:hypothetical protein